MENPINVILSSKYSKVLIRKYYNKTNSRRLSVPFYILTPYEYLMKSTLIVV